MPKKIISDKNQDKDKDKIKKEKDKVPFFSSLGIEFGYLINEKDRLRRDKLVSSYVDVLNWELSKDVPKYKKPWEVYADEGNTVEICSPICYNWNDLTEFYGRLRRITKKYGLVTHSDYEYSGGGHIHVGIPPFISKDEDKYFLFLANLFRDVNSRPYLNWIFNEYCDCCSAENLVASQYIKADDVFSKGYCYEDRYSLAKIVLPREILVSKFPSETPSNILDVFNVSKGHCLRYEGKSSCVQKESTVEFRFFDAKRNWKEVVLHVNFVNAYMKHIWGLTQKGIVVENQVLIKKDIKRFAENDFGWFEFELLLKDILGLNPKDYLIFKQLNYLPRKEIGGLK